MGQLDSGNAAWILTSASLVFLMTPGVAFFYGGMVRAKAVLNMMIMEAAALSVTMVIWVLWGWSIAYAGTSVGGVFGDPATGFHGFRRRCLHVGFAELQQLPGQRRCGVPVRIRHDYRRSDLRRYR